MSERVGTVLIASVQYFGRWRVLVCKMARTRADQENILEGIKADNWRELEGAARALMLARFGIIETKSYGLVCPRSLARRAKWTTWAARNRPQKERRKDEST